MSEPGIKPRREGDDMVFEDGAFVLRMKRYHRRLRALALRHHAACAGRGPDGAAASERQAQHHARERHRDRGAVAAGGLHLDGEQMSEQHYGRAPCGCIRYTLKESRTCGLTAVNCWEHTDAGCFEYIGKSPWHLAEALEAGLRAIAQAPEPKGEHGPCHICGDESGCGYPGPFPFSGRLISLDNDETVMFPDGGGVYSHKPIESSDTERPKIPLKDPMTGHIYSVTMDRPKLAPDGFLYDEPIWKDKWLARGHRVPVHGGGWVVSVAEFNELMAKAKVPVEKKGSSRIKCYWDGAKLKDGACPSCGNEQPPGEG